MHWDTAAMHILKKSKVTCSDGGREIAYSDTLNPPPKYFLLSGDTG